MAAFDVARFNALLQTKRFGRDILFDVSVGSTMDVARAAAEQRAGEGTMALADEQTAGRGRLGRSWVAPPAANLLPTLLLRPDDAILRQIAMIAPLAVCEAFADVAGIAADIKWPNDVQVGGKKIAGILIETAAGTAGRFVLVGTGINVNFDPRTVPEIRDIATSALAELGHEVEREPLLASYLLSFERMYEEARGGASLRDPWRARLVTIGRQVRASWPGGEVEGVAEGVDDDGSLLVRTPDRQLVTVEAGDVTLRG